MRTQKPQTLSDGKSNARAQLLVIASVRVRRSNALQPTSAVAGKVRWRPRLLWSVHGGVHRRDPPAWPFLWRGALPSAALALVVLFAVLPFARNSIQGSVARELRTQLNEAGFAWVGLAVAGQNVTLAGVEPQAGEGLHALALARRGLLPDRPPGVAPAR